MQYIKPSKYHLSKSRIWENHSYGSVGVLKNLLSILEESNLEVYHVGAGGGVKKHTSGNTRGALRAYFYSISKPLLQMRILPMRKGKRP